MTEPRLPLDPSTARVPTVARGRLLIVVAAVLWSTSGAFTKVLTLDTFLGLNTPDIAPLQIAFFRGLFAGLVLMPTLRRRDVSFRPLMLGMAACFALMNATFVSAMALGTAANAILLQYTAPLWMYLASVWWLGERADGRNLTASAVGLVGIAVILAGGWRDEQFGIVALGLASGVTYAGVVIFLRVLREASSRWLTVLNHLGAALALLPFVLFLSPPSTGQLVLLTIFGALQMAIPYWLMARGLQSVSPQEAGTITLLEPLLNPVWAWLISGEMPPGYTMLGGAFILGALVWRYWPRRGVTPLKPQP